MGADTPQHLVGGTQRRFLKVAVAVAVVTVLIATPLVLSGSLRLDLAYQFGLVPGEDVEKIAGDDDGITLVVIPVTVQVADQRQETRFHAAYLMRSSGDSTEFSNLDSGNVFSLPLSRVDAISADLGGEHLLVAQAEGLNKTQFLVTVATDTFEPLPADQEQPNVSGDWGTSIWQTRIGKCQGISPLQTYVACFKTPTFARFLAGDWQLDVQHYGQFKQRKEVFRGQGTLPLVGFTANDRWVYFQNEHGIWREPLAVDMFEQA